ncbi:hypothetical protein DFQ27_001765 [Actinomortierella ambigua]|uniref:F-box/LRR-repeat protein 15/At3g58940/PEG3-like LRR domain-containing protein n=1 Tax=Actinomortierella ambigua TaxID=1343610 RepID=A0A9P6QDB8_9FUNG|nr:hypothetical protein DFQ27_001765 [Actinomortierella ambigua]
MAHKALSLPEILTVVASNLLWRDIANCMRVNRLWHDAFLPSLLYILWDKDFRAIPQDSLRKYGRYIEILTVNLSGEHDEHDDGDDDENDLTNNDPECPIDGETSDGGQIGDEQSTLSNGHIVQRVQVLTRVISLEVRFLLMDPSRMPLRDLHALLTCLSPTLKHLQLTMCSYDAPFPLPLVGAALPKAMTFPKLAYVVLDNWFIESDDMDEIIRRCPALETINFKQTRDSHDHEYNSEDQADYDYDNDNNNNNNSSNSNSNSNGEDNTALSLDVVGRAILRHPKVWAASYNGTSLTFLDRFPGLQTLRIDDCYYFDGARWGAMIRQHCPLLKRIFWDKSSTSWDFLSSRNHPEQLLARDVGVKPLTEFCWRSDQWRQYNATAAALVTNLWTVHGQTLEKVEIVCDGLCVSALPFLECCPRLRSLSVVTQFFRTQRAACFHHDLVAEDGVEEEDEKSERGEDEDENENKNSVASDNTEARPLSAHIPSSAPWPCAKTLRTLAFGFTNLTDDEAILPVMEALRFVVDTRAGLSPFHATTTKLLSSSRTESGGIEGISKDTLTLRQQRTLAQRRLIRRLHVMEKLQFVKLTATWYIRRRESP